MTATNSGNLADRNETGLKPLSTYSAQSRCFIGISAEGSVFLMSRRAFAIMPPFGLRSQPDLGGKVKINPKEYVSQATAAKMRGVTKQAIANLIRRGKLKAVIIDNHVFLRKEDVENFTPDQPGPKPKTRRRKSN